MKDRWKNIVYGIISSVISAIVIALIFFLWNDYFFKANDLTGSWCMETETEKTSYPEYKGMKLYFDILLNQQGTDIIGTGEKVSAEIKGEIEEYEAPDRIHIKITGELNNRFIAKDTVDILYTEAGKKRNSSTILSLAVDSNNELHGIFISTIANSMGKVVLRRKNDNGDGACKCVNDTSGNNPNV